VDLVRECLRKKIWAPCNEATVLGLWDKKTMGLRTHGPTHNMWNGLPSWNRSPLAHATVAPKLSANPSAHATVQLTVSPYDCAMAVHAMPATNPSSAIPNQTL
jgi:hypothetical protein